MFSEAALTPDLKLHYPIPTHGGELLLVRHGQSTANAQNIGQGRADYPLSARGIEQAELTARHLAQLGGVAAVYASPLLRAFETGGAIARALALPCQPVADLVEIDIGELSGLTMAQLAEAYPQEVAAYEAAQARAPHPRHRELLPGWEPIASVVERMWRGVMTVATAHPGERIVVVAHGGVINAYLTHLLEGDATETPWAHSSTNCAISHVRWAPEGPQVLRLTDHVHLAELATTRTIFDPAPARS